MEESNGVTIYLDPACPEIHLTLVRREVEALFVPRKFLCPVTYDLLNWDCLFDLEGDVAEMWEENFRRTAKIRVVERAFNPIKFVSRNLFLDPEHRQFLARFLHKLRDIESIVPDHLASDAAVVLANVLFDHAREVTDEAGRCNFCCNFP